MQITIEKVELDNLHKDYKRLRKMFSWITSSANINFPCKEGASCKFLNGRECARYGGLVEDLSADKKADCYLNNAEIELE